MEDLMIGSRGFGFTGVKSNQELSYKYQTDCRIEIKLPQYLNDANVGEKIPDHFIFLHTIAEYLLTK